MRLIRPYIPLSVRVQIAERQMEAATGCVCTNSFGVPLRATGCGAFLKERLEIALFHLSRNGEIKLHLDHDPPLGARQKVIKNGEHVDYVPPANDPEFLIYREKREHEIKTNVRGVGAQYPDRVLIKKNRRLEEREGVRKPRVRFTKSINKSVQKRKWPKTKIASRPFPQGRKLRARAGKEQNR